MKKSRITAAALSLALCVAFSTGCAHGHECVHSRIQLPHDALAKQTVEYAGGTGTSFPGASSHEQVRKLANQRRLHTREVTGGEPLRIGVFYLMEDDPYACTGGKTEVEIGSAPSKSFRCSATLFTDCWYTCTAEDDVSLTSERFQTLKRNTDAAIAYFNKVLRVNQVTGGITVDADRPCSPTSPVKPIAEKAFPDHFVIGEGVRGADFVLYVTARPTTGSTLAFASACEIDQNGRPVVGHANWGASKIGSDDDLAVAIHEITHALGFSDSLFPKYPKVDGGNAVVTKTSFGATREVTMMVTPTVRDWVRDQFGCDSIEGAEIEDGGGDGTKGSHWEKRVFDAEYMTGAKSPGGVVYSGLTLAALQDSGWYRAVLTAADKLEYGYKEGCTFLRGSCAGDALDSWTRQHPGYTCDPSTESKGEKCLKDFTGKAYCDVRTWQPAELASNGYPLGEIPSYFRYYGDKFTGGGSALKDFCPTPTRYSGEYGDCRSSYNPESKSLLELKGETYGASSRCLTSSMVSRKGAFTGTATIASFPSSCHPIACSDANTVHFKVGEDWYTCEGEGQPILARGFAEGHVSCPNAAKICADKSLLAPAPFPSISAVEPRSIEKGTELTVKGSNFADPPAVTLVIEVSNPNAAEGAEKTYSSAPCEQVTVKSATELTCTVGDVPDQGVAHLRVANANGHGETTLGPVISVSTKGSTGSTDGGSAASIFQAECGGLKCYLMVIIILGGILVLCGLKAVCCGKGSGKAAEEKRLNQEQLRIRQEKQMRHQQQQLQQQQRLKAAGGKYAVAGGAAAAGAGAGAYAAAKPARGKGRGGGKAPKQAQGGAGGKGRGQGGKMTKQQQEQMLMMGIAAGAALAQAQQQHQGGAGFQRGRRQSDASSIASSIASSAASTASSAVGKARRAVDEDPNLAALGAAFARGQAQRFGARGAPRLRRGSDATSVMSDIQSDLGSDVGSDVGSEASSMVYSNESRF